MSRTCVNLSSHLRQKEEDSLHVKKVIGFSLNLLSCVVSVHSHDLKMGLKSGR